jgi:transposase
MGNVLRPEKQEHVRALGRLGWTLRRIEKVTGVRRETISAHLKAAGIDVRGPRRRSLTASDSSKPASSDSAVPCEGTPNPASSPGSDAAATEPANVSARVSSSACEPYRDFIEEAVRRDRTAKSIWQDLVDDHAFTGTYECVKRFVRRLRGTTPRTAHPRIVTAPGEEAQVDYGTGPLVRDPATGRYRRTRLFALTLGYSRRSIWLLTLKSSSQIWVKLHEIAFHRLGGAPSAIVLDNLREGVLVPGIYDPQLNPLYAAFLAHHGVIALPAKVGDPDRKGKVESAIGFAQTRLRGLRFESIEEAQAYLDRWAERWADTRVHGTTKRSVLEMFAEEQPELRPLPIEPFRVFEYGSRVVHQDGCVEVAGAYYGVPPRWLSATVHVQWSTDQVRILDPHTGELLREHVRQRKGGYRIHVDDESPKKPAHVQTLLRRAHNAGEHVGKVCGQIDRESGQTGVRKILGILSLVKKYGRRPVDRACCLGLEVGSPTYRFVRRYLERCAQDEPELRQVDDLIRSLNHYRHFIDRKTGELFS